MIIDAGTDEAYGIHFVLLDGHTCTGVVSLDTDLGTVTLAALDEHGVPLMNEDKTQWVTSTLTGKVEIVPKLGYDVQDGKLVYLGV